VRARSAKYSCPNFAAMPPTASRNITCSGGSEKSTALLPARLLERARIADHSTARRWSRTVAMTLSAHWIEVVDLP
jgi:hypothetical protein